MALVSIGPECWEWVGTRNRDGYGSVRVDRKMMLAHRVSYLVHFGEPPPKAYVLHTCDNPACVNPAHLYLGDQTANMADMMARNRAVIRAGEQHHKAKITEDLVRQIRASLTPPVELAKRLDVSVSTIRHVRSRRTWRHIA